MMINLPLRFIGKQTTFSLKMLFVLFVIYQFTSCAVERDYPFDSDTTESVVFSMNKANEPIKVQISETMKVLDTTRNFISNAQVFIYEDNAITDTLKYSEKSRNYVSNKIIGPDTEVGLEVKLDGGEKILKSTDRIPVPPKIDTIELEEDVLKIYDEGEEYIYSRLTLTLNEGAANTYYNIILRFITNDGERAFTATAYFADEYISDPDLIHADNVFHVRGVIIKNNNIIGQKKLQLLFIVYMKPDNGDYYYELEIQNISENYYSYVKDVYNIEGEDEVFNVFTNIEGGKGVFSFYSVSKDTIYPNQL